MAEDVRLRRFGRDHVASVQLSMERRAALTRLITNRSAEIDAGSLNIVLLIN